MSENDAKGDDAREEMERWDPLSGAEEGDGSRDAFKRAADAVDESLGLEAADRKPVPDDEAAVDDSIP